MKRYVLGFCFSRDLTKVVLIQKTRPEWQAGRLNGIGGHIEDGETPKMAMYREYREEADWNSHLEWTSFGKLRNNEWEVHLFWAISDRTPHISMVSEEGKVASHKTSTVLDKPTSEGAAPLPNLRYLIPMALNHISKEDKAAYFDIYETDLPKE
jgi:8-oxo-dGTP diphosphatase